MLTRLFSSASNRDTGQEYFTSDEIMTSILSSPELVLSDGSTRSRSRGRLVKKNKSSSTSTARPKTATGPTQSRTSVYSSRPSTSTSEYVTANSSATSLNVVPYTSEPLPVPLPNLSDFQRRSLTGKRQVADNMPLPPPIKITPLGPVVGGTYPPTPPGSYSGSSGGELTATSMAIGGAGNTSSRFMEQISPPFVREGRQTTRPSSAGSLFGRRKSKNSVSKERDTTSFFGRDGELGDIGVKPDVPPRSIFRGRSHSRSASHSGVNSKLGAGGGSIVPSKFALPAVPPKPELEAMHPALRSPPGTLATTTITTTTTHYHLTGETVEQKHHSFLPPLHIPQLELTFDGSSFSPSKRPPSATPALPGSDRRIDDLGSYNGSASGSSNNSKEELDSGPSSSNNSRQTLPDNKIDKSDKRPKDPIAPAPLFAGTNREKRGPPPISFYNTSQELYHTHLRQASNSVIVPKAQGERVSIENSKPEKKAEQSGNISSAAPVRSLTRGAWNGKGADRRRSQSENGRARASRKVEVEELTNAAKDGEENGSGFVAIGGGSSPSLSSKRSSKQDELFMELEKAVGMNMKEAKRKSVEPQIPTQKTPPLPLPKQQYRVSSEPKEPGCVSQIEPGFVFPFAQAVTVDEPVQLPSANYPTVYRSQSNPLTPTSVDMAINEAYRQMMDTSLSHEEVVRPKTAPSPGTASKNYQNERMGLGIRRDMEDGFVGGWKLENIRKLNGKSAPVSPSTPSPTSAFSSNPTSASTIPGSPEIPRVGHVRKFSYPTIEGMALVEEGKMGNGRVVTLADMLIEERSEQQKQQKQPKNQQTEQKPTYLPFRPVTIIVPQKKATPTRGSPEEIVLVDGTTLPAPVPVGIIPGKPKSRGESPHWEPMVPVPVEKSKNKKDEKEEKRKSKRKWFGSYKRSKDVEVDDGDSGLGPGLSNASSSSRFSRSTGSSRSGAAQPQIRPSTSGSDRSITPPSSTPANNQVPATGGKGISALEATGGIAEFPYTSQKLAAIAAAAHPAGPPHLHNRASTPGQPSAPSIATIATSIPASSRGRPRTRESGLRYEVGGSISPVTAENGKPDAMMTIATSSKGKSPASASQHSRHQSSPCLSRPGSAGVGAVVGSPKPMGKLFVVCCNCEYWHDLPSQMYYEMHERGCSVKCVYCLHGMEVRCCSGYSCAVYVLEKHHGK